MNKRKYRGKRVDNNVFVYGYYWQADFLNKNEICEHFIRVVEDEIKDYEVFADSVGEETGTHDEDGNMIYENQTVRIRNYNPVTLDWNDDWESNVQLTLDLTGIVKYNLDRAAYYVYEPTRGIQKRPLNYRGGYDTKLNIVGE